MAMMALLGQRYIALVMIWYFGVENQSAQSGEANSARPLHPPYISILFGNLVSRVRSLTLKQSFLPR
jgi:hypothetical protein